jgi:hypothetical protein
VSGASRLWLAPCTTARVPTRLRLVTRMLAFALFAFVCRKEPCVRATVTSVRVVASHAPPLPPASTERYAPTIANSKLNLNRAACGDPKSLERFFPSGSFWLGERSAELDEFVRSWYSRVLSRMAEPSLSCGLVVSETYRFVSIPTWGPSAAVRITVTTVPGLSAVVLTGQGGYDPGRPRAIARRAMANRERDEVLEAIGKADFWNLPTQDLEHRGFDGSEWLIEARIRDRYHVVARWSPEPGPFRDLCLVFARLGGVPTG